MILSLSGDAWQFCGFWPYTPFLGTTTDAGNPTGQVTDWMPASVPGCVHHDLLRNDMIQDPYIGQNSLACEWVENRWWVYKTAFTVDAALAGQDVDLVFLGVDYRCHVYLNGKMLCRHEGMFEPVRLNITDAVLFERDNELTVVLESAPDEMSQIGYTSRVRTQKSRFGYKWDFCTRLAHTGIWQDVYLEVFPGARLEHPYIRTGLEDWTGFVDVETGIAFAGAAEQTQYRVTAALFLCGERIDEGEAAVPGGPPAGGRVRLRLTAADPQLWWPNGHGGQPLYTVEIKLFRGDSLIGSVSRQTGIRSLAYAQNEGATEALPYIPVVNGKRIYIKGVNMTPLDLMIGSIPADRYERTLRLARDINVNLVRVWGGGIIEKEIFYDLCDRYGILVWQEFNQSSSGLENVPPEDDGYLRLLHDNAAAAILARRSHVCLAYWSGGNELSEADGTPVTVQNANIAMLARLVADLDPGRLFLPSSPSGPNSLIDVHTESLGKNHDVHGHWKYQGPEGHYALFNTSDSLLHSEFGADGYSCRETIETILQPEEREPEGMLANLAWRHHGEWWETMNRDRELFGESGLDERIVQSQYMQAEALRYAVESNRRRAFRNAGSIIWQFNEPWPNVSCTSMVEYGLRPKMAYAYVRRAYARRAVSLRYDKLGYAVGERFRGEVWVADDDCAFDGAVSYRILDHAGSVLQSGRFRAGCRGSHAVAAGCIEYAVAEVPFGLFFVELALEGCEPDGRNLYAFSHHEPPILKHLLSSQVFINAAAQSRLV